MKVTIVLYVVFTFFQSQINIGTAKAIEDTSDASSSTWSSEEEEELTDKEEACVDELHLNKELITDLNNKEIAPEDNDEFNQFIACYWQKEQWMDSEGNVKYDKLIAAMTEMVEEDLDIEDNELKSTVINNIQNSVSYCEKNPPTDGTSIGQTAVKIQNCIMKKLNELVDDDLSPELSELSSKEEDCVNELHLNKDRIIKLNDRDVAPEDNEDFNKFLACYWMKEEWMGSDGVINYDNLLFSLRAMGAIALQGEPHDVKSLMKKRITRAIAYCQGKNFKGENHGQTAAKLQNCITAKLSKGFYA